MTEWIFEEITEEEANKVAPGRKVGVYEPYLKAYKASKKARVRAQDNFPGVSRNTLASGLRNAIKNNKEFSKLVITTGTNPDTDEQEIILKNMEVG
jgi:hypothetical protein